MTMSNEVTKEDVLNEKFNAAQYLQAGFKFSILSLPP